MGFWLSWDVEDNVKMQVFVDNATTANKESPASTSLKEDEYPVQNLIRHGSKRKLEETEEAEEAEDERRKEISRNSPPLKNNRVYLVHRQSIFNISMCKLNRYRQALDPSLRRSVLICNTLRTIEKEMISEGLSPSQPVILLPSIETDKMTLDPLPQSSGTSSPTPMDSSSYTPSPSPYYPASSCSGNGSVGLTVVEPVPCKDNDVGGYEKNLTDLDSVSGRATPYPPSTSSSSTSMDINQNQSRSMWDSSSSSNSSSSISSSTTTISWSSVLSFPSQNELVTTNSSCVSEDVWPSNANNGTNGAYFDVESSRGTESSGGPNTSPSASSDSGISTASDEIFGDIDLSLYDFDLLPLSPPTNNNRLAAPPSAEELLRCFPPLSHNGQSIQASPIAISTSSSSSSSALPFITSRNVTRSYEPMCEDYDHSMHVMPAPP